MKIPVSEARELAKKYGLSHIVIFAYDGEKQNIVTFGKTIEQCAEAADFGNKLKDALGWPENLHADPPRVKNLKDQINELKKVVENLELKNKGLELENEALKDSNLSLMMTHEKWLDEFLSKPIEFVESDGTVRTVTWSSGDPSVGIPSGWESSDDVWDQLQEIKDKAITILKRLIDWITQDCSRCPLYDSVCDKCSAVDHQVISQSCEQHINSWGLSGSWVSKYLKEEGE